MQQTFILKIVAEINILSIMCCFTQVPVDAQHLFHRPPVATVMQTHCSIRWVQVKMDLYNFIVEGDENCENSELGQSLHKKEALEDNVPN